MENTNKNFIDSYKKNHTERINSIFMNRAIDMANKSEGGPFGAVITKDERIIGVGNNRVTITNDPTAHAEIIAIRNACNKINNFSLEDCILYTSCEPCPMCLSAIYWSRIKTVYYANTKNDAASIGFDDKEIYEEISKPNENRKIKIEQIKETNAIETFNKWKNNNSKIMY
tara:strand:- start:889 stop:1401 length:513 start_codon:yes stop_codon:yes gene_type:complete